MATTNRPRISYWCKTNIYAATCQACGAEVAKGAGWTQKDTGQWNRANASWVTYCDECAKANAKALPVEGEHGHVEVINLGDRSHAGLYTCTTCRQHVALVKSAKGRWYFCEVRDAEQLHADSMADRHHTRCAPWEPHHCTSD